MFAYPFYQVSNKLNTFLQLTTDKLTFQLSIDDLQFITVGEKSGSHFHPSSDLFVPSERKDVITSTVCWTAMLVILAGLTFLMGPIQMLKLYGVPYWVGFSSFCLVLQVAAIR